MDTLNLLHGASALSHLGVLRVQGEDASPFIHNQLTQDFLLLKGNQARLAAFLSPQGRVQATFVALQNGGPHDLLLVCSHDLLEAARKRMSMFVLRAKAELRDATQEFLLQGLAGNAVPLQARAPQAAAWSKFTTDGAGHLICLYPADGIVPLALCIRPAATARPMPNTLDCALWRWAEVRSAVATISAAVADKFIPQMLNYESVGGINFKKGCYPGQEVVARSQFRGTLKRRVYMARGQGSLPNPGDDVFDNAALETSCGSVVQSALSPQKGWAALLCLQIASSERPLFTAGNPAPLQLDPLPYPLLKDI